MVDDAAVLEGFSGPVRRWFTDVFAAPTTVQLAAWEAIAAGRHALVVAPTGSGKTLAAFLQAIDRLATEPRPDARGTRVVYVSPLKALGVDVERNLRVPLAGVARMAELMGRGAPDITVGVRSGDTSSRERAALLRRPPDILITTPESLYLMLTSRARETLAGVQTVIVDEIHALAGTKRGTHLALSLERLDALAGRDVQRIALSATVRPIDRVAAFLGGDRRVQVVAPPAEKLWEVHVRLPVPDITRPGPAPGITLAPDAAEPDPDASQSLWPHVEQQVYEAVMAGRSTLVFANSRRTAERLTSRLNEIWATAHDPASLAPVSRRPPAQMMSDAFEVSAAPAVIARAHHGSVSKEARAQIEAALKSGELRCVVATSSLELGIDMGAVDRVIQVSAPPSIASALQRIGRAGHQVGAVSAGDVYPLFRGDLVPSAVATLRMLEGRIEELSVPRNPLDVLAQQTVAAAVATGELGLDVEEWFASVRRAMPYAGLDRGLFDAVLELLTGAYPSADFGDLRARLVEDGGRLFARPGALRLAVTSGGTIPDRGLFGVFLAGAEGPGRRVGELDEEMVYESRVGDVFTLGASSWRILEITRDQVLVTPAPGHTGRLPFWHGEDESRPAELGAEIGRFRRSVLRDPAALKAEPLDANVRVNIASYLREQAEATGQIPDDRTIVVERFRDEVGDWRFVLHSSLGRAVLAPWALAIGSSLRQATGIDVTPSASDDGIIWRLPDCDAAEAIAEHLLPDPDDAARLITDEVGGTALFASRFRECAARALLLPQRDPGHRSPLWQQRMRAAQLLAVARLHPRFPIIIETVREVLQDVYDLPELIELLRRLRAGRVRLVEVTTSSPSPFAAGMLMRYTGEYLYEGDVPLAEKRAGLLSMDPALLAAVLGTVDLRELLDPGVIAEVEAELQHTAPGRRARTVDELADLPRLLGPIPLPGVPDRVIPDLLSTLSPDLSIPLLGQLAPSPPPLVEPASARASDDRFQPPTQEQDVSTNLRTPLVEPAAGEERASRDGRNQPPTQQQEVSTSLRPPLVEPAAGEERASRDGRNQLPTQAQEVSTNRRLADARGRRSTTETPEPLVEPAAGEERASRDDRFQPPTQEQDVSTNRRLADARGRCSTTETPEPLVEPASGGRNQPPTQAFLAAAPGNRALVLDIAGGPHLVAASDVGLLHLALGIPLPPGAVGVTDAGRDPLAQLLARYARTHAPFTTVQVAAAFGLGQATAQLVLEREVSEKRLLTGHFTPGRTEVEFTDPEVLRRIRQRCLALARAQIQPVPASGLARFLAAWHGVDDRPTSSPDEVLLALQHLAGAALPASAWETHILPARLRGYSPAHLDELVAEGEVVIRLRGAVGAEDPLVALVPAADLDLLAPPEPAAPELVELARDLGAVGGLFTDVRAARESLAEPTSDGRNQPPGRPQEVSTNLPGSSVAGQALNQRTPLVEPASARVSDDRLQPALLLELWWRAAEAGLIAPASMAPIRARIGGGSRGAHKAQRPAPRGRARLPRPGRVLLGRPGPGGAPPTAAGRWYVVHDPQASPAEQAVTQASAWLERFGVISRGAVMTDSPDGGFAAAYRVLAELERAGKVVRGYVVEGLGASQFATPEIIDHIRTFADSPDDTEWPSGVATPKPLLVAAADPANPYGSILGWPDHPTARPSRAAGAVVVLADGLCLAHLTRGGRNLTVFEPAHSAGPDRATRMGLVGRALQGAVSEGRMSRIRIEEIDGERAGVGPDVDALLRAGARLTPRGVTFDAAHG